LKAADEAIVNLIAESRQSPDDKLIVIGGLRFFGGSFGARRGIACTANQQEAQKNQFFEHKAPNPN
jgi:hypothetical protein